MTKRSGGFETYAGMAASFPAASIHQSTLFAAAKAAVGVSAMVDHKNLLAGASATGVSAMANYKMPAMTTKLAAAGIHQSTLFAAAKAAARVSAMSNFKTLAGVSAMSNLKTLAGVSAMANYKMPAMTTKLAAARIHQSTLFAAAKAAAGVSAMSNYKALAGVSAMSNYKDFAGMASKIAEVSTYESPLLATVRRSTLPQNDPSSQQMWTPSLWCPEAAAAVVSIFVFTLLVSLWLHEANRLGDTPATVNFFEILGDLSEVVEWSAAAWGATLLVLRGKSD